jgi:hypothetical protein
MISISAVVYCLPLVTHGFGSSADLSADEFLSAVRAADDVARAVSFFIELKVAFRTDEVGA